MTTLDTTWDALCDQLKAFGHETLRAEQPLDRSEGLRHALRFMSHLADNFIENADPAYPEFRKIASATRKFYGDCVDTDYFQAAISPRHSYRIRGTRGTGPHLSVIVYRMGMTDRIAGNLVDDQMGIRPDGSFDLWLSAQPMEGPGILIDERCNEVLLRQYHKDRAGEQDASFTIERIGPDLGPRGELQGEWLQKSLGTCTRALTLAIKRLNDYRDGLRRHTNALVDSRATGMSEMFFGTSANKYLAGWFQLKPDESLEFTLPRVTAQYVGINLYNRWFESLEFRDHVVSLNDSQMVYDAEGNARITIGGPPRAHNWIDTCGHEEGSILVRFLETAHELPAVSCVHRTVAAERPAPAAHAEPAAASAA